MHYIVTNLLDLNKSLDKFSSVYGPTHTCPMFWVLKEPKRLAQGQIVR